MTWRPFRGWAKAYPARAWPLAVGVVLAFAAALAVSWRQEPLRGDDLRLYGLLVAGATVTMVAWRLLGARELRDHELDQDLTSAWLLTGAVLLPVPWALLLALPMELGLQRLRGAVLLPRRLVNGAVLGLAAGAAGLAHDAVLGAAGHAGMAPYPGLQPGPAEALALPVAAVALLAVNVALVGSMHVLYGHGLTQLVTDVSVADEVGAAGMGALMAAAYTVTPLLLVVAGLPPLALLQRSLQHRQLLVRARTDARTGLLHVGGWQEQAERTLRRCVARGLPVSVLALDVDHFKSINDRYGHAGGDEVLVALARTLQAHMRPGDVLGRIGGEEFAVLLPSCAVADARRLAERLRTGVAEGPAHGADTGSWRPVTISLGVAQLARGQDVLALLQRADTALYAAKAAGRNRVVVADDVPARDVVASAR